MGVDDTARAQTALHGWHAANEAHLVERDGWVVAERFEGGESEVRAARERVALVDLAGRVCVRLRGEVTTYRTAIPDVGGVADGEMAVDGRSVPVLFARLAEDELSVLGDRDTRAGILTALPTNSERLIVVDATSGIAGTHLIGPRSRDVLARLTDIDLGEKGVWLIFGRVAQCAVAGVGATLIRRDWSQMPGYEIHVPRDYGQYLWETIMRTGEQFGIQAMGLAAYAGE